MRYSMCVDWQPIYTVGKVFVKKYRVYSRERIEYNQIQSMTKNINIIYVCSTLYVRSQYASTHDVLMGICCMCYFRNFEMTSYIIMILRYSHNSRSQHPLFNVSNPLQCSPISLHSRFIF